MTEREIVATTTPATVDSLGRDLASLGDLAGATVLVHCSLSRLGWVAGGAQAVVEALVRTVGPSGTVAAPTHSSHLSEPSYWGDPAVPREWWQTIRDQAPTFDPRVTPTRGMGAVADTVRAHSQARRSDHPMVSFAAIGPAAERVTRGHELASGLGEGSPLARLYEQDAWVLLLGVHHDVNTSLHLAEHRAGRCGQVLAQGSPVLVDGQRTWVTYDHLEGDSADFGHVGDAFAAAGGERRMPVGAGTGRLMRQRELVDHAVDFFRRHRPR